MARGVGPTASKVVRFGVQALNVYQWDYLSDITARERYAGGSLAALSACG